jgi:hypothetical protein
MDVLTAYVVPHSAMHSNNEVTGHSCRQNHIQHATLPSTSTLKLARPRLCGSRTTCSNTIRQTETAHTYTKTTVCVNRA